jgi:23S rRNA pseudouridine2605 synthase
MRLQRALARAGVASRRTAESLITAGRVRVNGQVATLGQSADPERDRITVDAKRIQPARAVWIALHKPVGYVVSKRDPEGRSTVFSLLPQVPGLTYVGRLDVMTSGLLLFTTDGDAANRLTHPRYGVERTYRALVHGRRTDEIRRLLDKPVLIDRRPVRITEALLRPAEGGRTDMRISLAEGRYRIVRRLAEHLGLKVERLTRLSHGPVRLGTLQAGKWRYLTRAEVAAVSRAGA